MKSSPLAVARLATLLLTPGAILTCPTAAGAEDAFKTFRQLDGTVKMPKLNAFSGSGAVRAPVARDVTLQASLTKGGQIM